MYKIALDGMGGDFGPIVTVKGAMRAIEEYKDIEIEIYGNEDDLRKYLTNDERITIVPSKTVIDMGESDPIRAIRNNRDSSMVMAMRSVKEERNHAVVSAGPTQALIVGAHLIVKRMDKMHRVALAPIVPSLDKRGRILLDVGANIELRAEHILELAVYASVVAEHFLERPNPKVGLINIGTEEGKGRQVDKDAYNLLSESPLINFSGNIEPKEVLSTECDILITDGFTGNIILKTIEGTAKDMGHMLEEEIKSSLGGKMGYLLMRTNLRRFKKRLDSSEIGGAMIFGIKAPVIKAHGSSNELAIFNAIRQARRFVSNDVIKKVEEALLQMPDFEGGEQD